VINRRGYTVYYEISLTDFNQRIPASNLKNPVALMSFFCSTISWLWSIVHHMPMLLSSNTSPSWDTVNFTFKLFFVFMLSSPNKKTLTFNKTLSFFTIYIYIYIYIKRKAKPHSVLTVDILCLLWIVIVL